MIGEKIRDLRKKIGITQEQLAGRELTKSYVSQVELGRIHPSRKALNIIARRLGKPLGYFLDNDDDLRTVDVLLQASEALLISQRFEDALVGLNEAQFLAQRIGRDDILAQIEATMGRVDMARRNYAEAAEHFKSALARLSPTDDIRQLVTISAALGEAAQEAGLFHEAVANFHRSVDAARRHGGTALKVESLVRYGDFCAQVRQWHSALVLYQEAQSLDPAATGLLARITVAQCNLSTGSPAKTPDELKAAVDDLDALPPRPLKWRITCDFIRGLVRMEQHREARRLLDFALQTVGQHNTSLADLLETALVWLRSTQDPAALPRYLDLIESQPDLPAFNAVKAHALELRAEYTADPKAALSLCDQALRLLPDDRDLRLARAALGVKAQLEGAWDELWSLVVGQSDAERQPIPFGK